MRSLLIPLLLAVLSFPASLFGAEKVVALATLTNFIPFCFSRRPVVEIPGETIPPGSDSLQLQGYSWDVVRESYHAMGYTIKLYVVPWERAVHYLQTGKVAAVFPANRTKGRQRDFIFSKGLVDEMRMVIYLPLDSTLRWDGLESMNGLRVAAVRGWSYGEQWEDNQQIRKERTDSILQSFRLLDKNRLSGVVGYEAAYDHALKQADISQKYRKAGPFEVISEYLMGRKGSPESDLAISAFDRGREKLGVSATIPALAEKWL